MICSLANNVAAVCPKDLPELTGFHVLTSRSDIIIARIRTYVNSKLRIYTYFCKNKTPPRATTPGTAMRKHIP